ILKLNVNLEVAFCALRSPACILWLWMAESAVAKAFSCGFSIDALPGKKPWNMLNFCLILEAFRQFLLIGGYDASVAVFFAHSEGKSQGGGNRLAQADAALRHDPSAVCGHLFLVADWFEGAEQGLHHHP
ncbi:hypothetical protein, partial [Brucella melitensis]